MEGIPGREDRERAGWRWWNIAAATIVTVVAVAIAAGGYAFWWMFLRGGAQ